MSERSKRRTYSAEQRQRWNLANRYGLTPEAWEEMRTAQNGECAICGEKMGKICVDHCHETGKVRGMLCHGCNIKLPALEDVEFKESALAYLRRWT